MEVRYRQCIEMLKIKVLTGGSSARIPDSMRMFTLGLTNPRGLGREKSASDKEHIHELRARKAMKIYLPKSAP